MSGTNVDRKYKDRLFRFLFGREENKEYALSLYNALNGTSYTNADELEFTTIEDVVYMGMKNDVSFMIQNFMTLYEHQSTYNPNMPLRGIMYFGKLYDRYVEKVRKSIAKYGKEKGIEHAVDDCIRDNILKEVLSKNKAEVIGMTLTEYDEQEQMQLFKKEAWEEGRQESWEKGLKALVDSLKNFLPDFDMLYSAVIKNEEYKNATKEQVKKYF